MPSSTTSRTTRKSRAQPDRRAACGRRRRRTPATRLPAGTYDDELLDRHFITGDGRGNENIALTAVHHVFHSEHNRQVDEIKATVLATGDAAFIASWQLSPRRVERRAPVPGCALRHRDAVPAPGVRGVRAQGAADHRRVPGRTNYDAAIDPAIVAEFAHAVYRVGHSMLTETVDRLDPNFSRRASIGLIEAFLNPLAVRQRRHADAPKRRPAPSCAA